MPQGDFCRRCEIHHTHARRLLSAPVMPDRNYTRSRATEAELAKTKCASLLFQTVLRRKKFFCLKNDSQIKPHSYTFLACWIDHARNKKKERKWHGQENAGEKLANPNSLYMSRTKSSHCQLPLPKSNYAWRLWCGNHWKVMCAVFVCFYFCCWASLSCTVAFTFSLESTLGHSLFAAVAGAVCPLLPVVP